MIKLYGVVPSNFYNVVKLTLLEKKIPFEEVYQMPSQDSAFLRLSPLGKIPILETPQGFLSESQAIMRYLELSHPDPPLYPSDPFLAGRAQQIHNLIDLYIDMPARSLLPAAFFGGSATEAEIAAVFDQLKLAATGLSRISRFKPFIAGEQLTHADIAAFNTGQVASQVMQALGKDDPMLRIACWQDYLAEMKERPMFAKVAKERKAAVEAYLKKS